MTRNGKGLDDCSTHSISTTQRNVKPRISREYCLLPEKMGTSVDRNEFFNWTRQQAQRQTQLAHTNLIEPPAVCMVAVNLLELARMRWKVVIICGYLFELTTETNHTSPDR